MTKYFLLKKALVQKMARATNALLILQWAHDNTLSHHWNATDPERCETTHNLGYWLMVVVKDDEPRSSLELMHAARQACKGHCNVCVRILYRKEALRKMKSKQGDFAMVYRLGYSLYNTDIKAFPQPGHARNDKKQLPARPVVAVM